MPLRPNIHIDQALTNISRMVKNAELVADKVWPIVPVKKDSDKFFRYDSANLRLEDDDWAPRTVAKEVNWETTQDSYVTERRALQQLVEDSELRNADRPINVMADTTEILQAKMLLRREKRLADILQDTANYDVSAVVDLSAVPGNQWDDFASPDSDPNEDVANARVELSKKIFQRPNLVVLPRTVFEKVREHPKVFERIKFTERAIITAEILASLWDVERVLVAGAGENTAPEGQPDVLAFVWGKNVFIGWVTTRPTLKTPSWGYHLQSQRPTVDRWRDDERKGETIRNSFDEVPKLVTKSAGFLFQNAVA